MHVVLDSKRLSLTLFQKQMLQDLKKADINVQWTRKHLSIFF